MIRVLIMIAVVGFVLSLATLTAAFAVGGPDLIARGGWHWAGAPWGRHHGGADDSDGMGGFHGASVTRTLEWSGGDSLDIDLPADVRYVQAPGPASVSVTGRGRDVRGVVIRGDRLDFEGHHGMHRGRLSVVVRAPGVQAFDISGASTLAIEDYDQPRLAIDASGNARVTARGRTDTLSLELSGNSEADAGGLAAKVAEVDASGASEAALAPIERARLEISGAAEIELLTRPRTLETDIAGAGKLRQRPPPSPQAAPPSPAAKGEKL